jgi:hypothetical protein
VFGKWIFWLATGLTIGVFIGRGSARRTRSMVVPHGGN